jgi:hypothetical protein
LEEQDNAMDEIGESESDVDWNVETRINNTTTTGDAKQVSR